METLDQAISRYFEVCGMDAMQPDRSLSTVSQNGTAFLKNVNGSLDVVISMGLVFDRICGKRLDEPADIFLIKAGVYSGATKNIDVFLKSQAGTAMRIDRVKGGKV